MTTNAILLSSLALLTSLGAPTWEKAPEKWDLKDVYRILQDSPWSPAESKIEGELSPGELNSETGLVSDSRSNPTDATTPVPGIRMSHSKSQPATPVLWWSSKTIRLAEQRLRQLENPSQSTGPLQVEDLQDYVLAIEGSKQLRIFRDAKDDLRDTVFLELPNGATLDIASVQFVEGVKGEEPRTEFHFSKQIEGTPTLDPSSERVIFHCKAVAKTVLPSRENAIALRAEFKPRIMRVHGVPDL
jgi:hypothetical protein